MSIRRASATPIPLLPWQRAQFAPKRARPRVASPSAAFSPARNIAGSQLPSGTQRDTGASPSSLPPHALRASTRAHEAARRASPERRHWRAEVDGTMAGVR